MKQKILRAGIAALSLSATFAGIAKADTGYTATFATAVTYMNIGTGPAKISLDYYAEGSSSPILITLPELAVGASSSIYAGSVSSLPDGFKGSGVLSSNQPIAATLVQISSASGTSVKNRPLSNGFSSGASSVLIATVLKDKFDTTTRFSVQNADGVAIDASVKFYNADAGGALASTQSINNLPPGAAQYFDAGTVSGLPSPFNGSVVVDAVQHGTSTSALVVATALNLSTTAPDASAFEGVSGGANTVYMPSAFCKYLPTATDSRNSAYAVQNTSSSQSANVTVTYSNGAVQTAVIPPGTKNSFVTCNATNMSENFIGSAVITSVGAPIVAIGKITGEGLYTAFVGATSGSSKLALPYVRWTPQSVYNSGQRQRAYIAIQNIGSALAAGAATVKYIDKSGTVLATQPLGALATGQKQSVYSAQVLGDVDFGFYPSDGSYGGGAIIEGPSGSQLVAVVRIQSYRDATSEYAEDYNAIPVQ